MRISDWSSDVCSSDLPFTPDYVADRAGIDAGELRRAASLFAKESRLGGAAAGTGPSMAPHSNLSDHLIETLNVVFGRIMREGERVANPGARKSTRLNSSH